MNALHFQDGCYREAIPVVVEKAERKYRQCHPALKWELIKTEVIAYSTVYSLNKAKEKKKKFRELNRTIDYLQTMLQVSYSEECEQELNIAKAQMDSYLQAKVRTLMFIGRAKYHMEGERNSKYFYSMAKSRSLNRTMLKIQKEDGALTCNPNEILKEQKHYYQKLYTANPKVQFKLTNTTTTKITLQQRTYLEQEITIEEVQAAVNKFPCDKTPGADGIIAGFYQEFFAIVGHHLHQALLYGLQQKQLHLSARRGVLTLIPKHGRDLLQLKNWRPLTMLSMDYKVLSKVLDM